ncbi:MAG: SEC-C domain-containing protein [Ilumatobacter sp.]|uniref:YecA family protein n=1 Tax=Ilumatobacter sp. TaxID=1967498 RepID=UPI003297D1EA
MTDDDQGRTDDPLTDDDQALTDDPAPDDPAPDDPDSDDSVERVHRATIEFGLDADQADAFQALVDSVTVDGADEAHVDPATVIAALDDRAVAEAAWTRWSDEDLLGRPLDRLVESIADDVSPGAAWLRARHHAWFSRTDEAIATLEAARSSGHHLVLCELAAIEADRGNPVAARDLLREADVDVEIDLDTEFDPFSADDGFGAELAEEIAPFAAIRPRPMAGRNDRCPCGSGKKYKQCHLGNEMHPLEDRAGWLYVKLMRFIGVNNPNFPAVIADDIVDGVASEDLRSMVHESYLPIDLALFEGGVASWFLGAKRSLLPADEVEMVQSWIDASRSVYEVVRSRPGTMDVIDLATRERMTVVDTVPDEPLDTGWKLIGRLVPVGDTYRAFGGFLPINDDMAASLLEGFATRKLETVAITIGQLFEVAATQDEIQDMFAGSLDTGELESLAQQLGLDTDDTDDTGADEEPDDAP